MKRDSQQFKRFIREYWSYYRELERDLLATRKYVSFEPVNYSTYSLEYLKLFQAACSEVDVLGKTMAYAANNNFQPDDRRNSILKWWFEIQDAYHFPESQKSAACPQQNAPALSDSSCTFLDELTIKPWESFRTEWYLTQGSQRRGTQRRIRCAEKSAPPSWWTSHNKVKHNRTSPAKETSGKTYYHEANLGNVISAFAALYILEMSYMASIGTKNDLEAFADYSQLFEKKSTFTTEEVDSWFH